jgi:hypothetical protein
VSSLASRLGGVISIVATTIGTLLLCRAVFDWLAYGRFVASLLHR